MWNSYHETDSISDLEAAVKRIESQLSEMEEEDGFYSGDRGYQDLWEDKSAIEERIEELKKGAN